MSETSSAARRSLIRGKAVKQPPENWLILPGRHEGIISEEQFERVQQKLTACPSRSVRKDLKLKNPLSGVLRCGVCGGSMTRKSGGRGKRPPSMRPLLSSDLFFGSECGGRGFQRSRRPCFRECVLFRFLLRTKKDNIAKRISSTQNF